MKRDDKKTEGETSRHSRKGNTPWLEWLASGLGLLLTVAVVSMIAWDAVHESADPPAIVVERGTVKQYEGGFTLEVRVRNASRETAAGVEIEGVLRRDGQAVETGRATLDYVPGKSVRRAGLFFTQDPRTFEVRLRALGYAEP